MGVRAARAEEALVHLHNAEHGPRFFACDQDALAQAEVNPVDCVAVCTGQFGSLEGCEIG